MNYYSIVSPSDTLKCDQPTFDRLDELLQENCDRHAMSLRYSEGKAFLHADEAGCMDELPEAFLKAFGEVIAANGLPFLQFGCAYTADRNIADSHGGGKYRIYADGRLVCPKEVWPK